MIKRKYRFMAEAGDGGEGGGVAAPTPAPAPSPAANQAPAPAPAAPAPSPSPAPAPAESKGYWPEDWRTRAAKGDEKLANRFARYGSPEDALDALINAQNRISAGELKPVLGKDASPEQLAEWRQANGIPESPDKYEVMDLGGGFKIPEPDKPLADKIVAAAHATNQTPEQIKATLRAFYEVRDMVDNDLAERDKKAESDGQEALRQEWGADYRRHANLIEGLLDLTAGGLKENLLNGRMADGTLVRNSPAVQKFLLSLALINSPAGVVVPSSGGSQLGGVQDEIAKIEKVMRENRTAYNKDEKMQARYRELLGAREQLKDRKAA
jgi:hypothetical protein